VCDDQPVGQEWIDGKPVNRLREAVGERLSARGWSLLEQDEFFGTGTFAVPLGDGFAATFVVVRDLLEDESGALVLSPVGLMGLDYSPARRLTTALTGVARSGLVLKQPSLAVTLPDSGDLAEAADALVRFAVEQTPSLSRFADVDALIEILRQRGAVPSVEPMAVLNQDEPMVPPPGYSEIPDPLPELVAALLAGAGRYEEARRPLAECEQHDPLDGDRENARFVRQLTRWVKHAGTLALPKTPAEWPPDWRARWRDSPPLASLAQFAVENMPEIEARREALRAVRAGSAGKSRDELRTLLHGELADREVSMWPVAFEQTIESVATAQEPFGKTRITVRGLRALWDLAHSTSPLHRVVSDQPDEGPDDHPDPAWMTTPERAAYPIRVAGRERVAVQLDPAAVRWLDGVLSASGPVMARMRPVEVWFAADDEPSGGLQRLSLYIGSKRVGELDAEATERFRGALEAAAERDEDLWTDAHLTRLPGTRHVLDVPVPASLTV
jgi:hypothetical protein